MMNYVVFFTAGCLLCLGLVWNTSGIATVDPGFRQLLCVFETSQRSLVSQEMEIIRLNVRLVLSRTQGKDSERSQPESLPPDTIPSFVVQESSLDILQYINEDIDMLDCRINLYSTANRQIIGPGREIGGSSADSWFTCTIKHTAGKYTTTAFLMHNQKEGENRNPGHLLPGITERLHVSEKPIVTVNVDSLSLVEGEQHKLVCSIRHYYPHDVEAQWLREPKDSQRVPYVLKNVLSSSHQQSSNGTYSSSRYFLLTASLNDNGHKYTCLVDHQSLQAPIRKSVTVEVKEATPIAWLLLLLSLTVCLAGTLWYYHKGKLTSRLPNPGCGEGRTLLYQPFSWWLAMALPRTCVTELGYKYWEVEVVLCLLLVTISFFSLFPCPSEEH
ncbi:uncharacterized protein LOC128854197 isoform X8 [Cuculus canorus]|uniref:uncharacterized protein LOC128854197 isoform X8 n=1 Tax=Cuculus canorus TaxID=55661 RepID=UPI0023AAB925|nr:uncharacterized protein LOC128854197 isoform X8 [Cuculus canorus]